jgi:hypothetical protein
MPKRSRRTNVSTPTREVDASSGEVELLSIESLSSDEIKDSDENSEEEDILASGLAGVIAQDGPAWIVACPFMHPPTSKFPQSRSKSASHA